MRKIKSVFAIILLTSLFMACSSDDKDSGLDDLPITGLELPKQTEPLKTGEPITIKGKGFIQKSEIWLQAVTKTKVDGAAQATIEEFTAEYIKFIAPKNIMGKQAIILKQNSKVYPLGELEFETNEPEVKGSQLYCLADYFNIYSLSPTDDSFEKVHSLTKGSYSHIDGITSYRNGFYFLAVDDDEEYADVKYFDFGTKTEKLIKKNWNYEKGLAIGIIGGKLHTIGMNADKIVVSSMVDNGAETIVKSFTNPLPKLDWDGESYRFEYNEKEQVIILSPGAYNTETYTEEYGVGLALNMKDGTAKTYQVAENNHEALYYLNIKEETYRFLPMKSEQKSYIAKVNPSTLETVKEVGSIAMTLNDPVYWEATNSVMLLDYKKFVSLDLETMETKTLVESTMELEYLFVVEN